MISNNFDFINYRQVEWKAIDNLFPSNFTKSMRKLLHCGFHTLENLNGKRNLCIVCWASIIHIHKFCDWFLFFASQIYNVQTVYIIEFQVGPSLKTNGKMTGYVPSSQVQNAKRITQNAKCEMHNTKLWSITFGLYNEIIPLDWSEFGRNVIIKCWSRAVTNWFVLICCPKNPVVKIECINALQLNRVLFALSNLCENECFVIALIKINYSLSIQMKISQSMVRI